jgi:hypothetical protein
MGNSFGMALQSADLSRLGWPFVLVPLVPRQIPGGHFLRCAPVLCPSSVNRRAIPPGPIGALQKRGQYFGHPLWQNIPRVLS